MQPADEHFGSFSVKNSVVKKMVAGILKCSLKGTWCGCTKRRGGATGASDRGRNGTFYRPSIVISWYNIITALFKWFQSFLVLFDRILWNNVNLSIWDEISEFLSLSHWWRHCEVERQTRTRLCPNKWRLKDLPFLSAEDCLRNVSFQCKNSCSQ